MIRYTINSLSQAVNNCHLDLLIKVYYMHLYNIYNAHPDMVLKVTETTPIFPHPTETHIHINSYLNHRVLLPAWHRWHTAQPHSALLPSMVSGHVVPSRHRRMREWATDRTWLWTFSCLNEQVFVERQLCARCDVHHLLCEILWFCYFAFIFLLRFYLEKSIYIAFCLLCLTL